MFSFTPSIKQDIGVRPTPEFKEILRRNPDSANLKLKDVEKSLRLGKPTLSSKSQTASYDFSKHENKYARYRKKPLWGNQQEFKSPVK